MTYQGLVKIERTIKSCKTEEHVKVCLEWINKLTKPNPYSDTYWTIRCLKFKALYKLESLKGENK